MTKMTVILTTICKSFNEYVCNFEGVMHNMYCIHYILYQMMVRCIYQELQSDE